MIDFLRRNGVVVTGRNVSITMAQQSKEVGAAGVYLIQADIQGSATFCLLLRHAPSEVNVNQLDVPLAAALLQLREH